MKQYFTQQTWITVIVPVAGTGVNQLSSNIRARNIFWLKKIKIKLSKHTEDIAKTL